MQFEITQVNSAIIIRFTKANRLNVLNSNEVKIKLNEILSEPESKLIVDFEEIYFIDSSGFAVLLSAFKKAKKSNSLLKFCNINKDVLELFELMQLNTIFDIQQNITACLDSFEY